MGYSWLFILGICPRITFFYHQLNHVKSVKDRQGSRPVMLYLFLKLFEPTHTHT